MKISPWAPGLLVFIIAKKYSPVSLSKRVLCSFNNSDYKYRLQVYEIFYWGYIWVLYGPGPKLGNLGNVGNLLNFYPTFLFPLFDFDQVLKIKYSEEVNSEKKFRGFRGFRRFRVFDLPLFKFFNQVPRIQSLVQID